MKNIDKIIFAVMAVMLVACTEMPQADVDDAPQKDLIGMEFNADVDSDVEPLVRTTYSGRKVYWEEDDVISMFFEGDGISCEPFAVSSRSDDNQHAVFASKGDEAADSFLAVYPHLASNAYDGTNVKVTIPSEQTAVANTFASGANVAVAYSTDRSGTLQFRNVGGLLAFRFETAEDAARTASVTFRAKTETEGVYHGIAGTAKVTMREQQYGEDSQTVGYMPVVEGEGTIDHVTMHAPEGGFESGDTKIYYAVIYPREYAHGFEVVLTTDEPAPADFLVAEDASGSLVRNSLLYMGEIANPYDVLPEEIIISLDFYNESNVNPLGTFPKMAEQSADGNDYTFNYSYQYEGQSVVMPLTFTIYKGSGYSYTYLNGAATGSEKYFYLLNSGTSTCMRFPAIRGRYLKSVSFSHTGTAYSRSFRLQEGYPEAGHYYTVSVTPASADAVGTGVVTFPTGTEDTAQLNATKAGKPYYVEFTNKAKYSITNITLVYTKQEPVADEPDPDVPAGPEI